MKKCQKKVKRVYRRFQYSQAQLTEDFDVVKADKLSICKASQQYKIPKGTLVNKLKLNDSAIRKMGPSTVLTFQEEERIEKWIINKAKIGYPMHSSVIKNSIKRVLHQAPRQNSFVDNYPGKKWFKLFLQRHPVVKERNTEVISKTRASVTEKQLRQWYFELEDFLKKEDAISILRDPSRIYNLDETGIQMCPKTGKLLGPKKEKNLYFISPGQEKECITVLCCFSADGKDIAPMIVFPYKRFPPKEIASSVPDDFIIGHSPSGWMTIEIYNQYIKNEFFPEIVKRGIKFPVLLLFDGHSSHISLQLHDFCVENNILLYCLYPNSTHIMQPCDVGIFRSLKIFWKKKVSEHSQKSLKPITRSNFAPIFHEAYKKSCDPEVIKKAFECCGLFPFDANRVYYSKCMSNRHKQVQDNLNDRSASTPLIELYPDKMLS